MEQPKSQRMTFFNIENFWNLCVYHNKPLIQAVQHTQKPTQTIIVHTLEKSGVIVLPEL